MYGWPRGWMIGLPLLPGSQILVRQFRLTKLAEHRQVTEPKWDRRNSSLYRQRRTGTVGEVNPPYRCTPASRGEPLGKKAEQLNLPPVA